MGALIESWTAPVYILTAEFADVFPPYEDQMPFNGNPHPLPGQLQPNLNMFVLPQFPEIGWDVNPDQLQQGNIGEDQLDAEEVQVDEMDNEDQLSMVLNPSEGSNSSVQLEHQDNM
jgi:hypothetical protein